MENGFVECLCDGWLWFFDCPVTFTLFFKIARLAQLALSLYLLYSFSLIFYLSHNYLQLENVNFSHFILKKLVKKKVKMNLICNVKIFNYLYNGYDFIQVNSNFKDNFCYMKF